MPPRVASHIHTHYPYTAYITTKRCGRKKTQNKIKCLSYNPHQSRLARSGMFSTYITQVGEEADCLFPQSARKIYDYGHDFIACAMTEAHTICSGCKSVPSEPQTQRAVMHPPRTYAAAGRVTLQSKTTMRPPSKMARMSPLPKPAAPPLQKLASYCILVMRW